MKFDSNVNNAIKLGLELICNFFATIMNIRKEIKKTWFVSS